MSRGVRPPPPRPPRAWGPCMTLLIRLIRPTDCATLSAWLPGSDLSQSSRPDHAHSRTRRLPDCLSLLLGTASERANKEARKVGIGELRSAGETRFGKCFCSDTQCTMHRGGKGP